MPIWRRRPRLRYGLRLLLLFVTLVCLWLGRVTYLARQQRDAIDSIARSEGVVIFDYEEDALGTRIPNPTPRGSKWLRQTIGEEYFRTPIVVDLATNSGRRQRNGAFKATTESLAALSKLRDVHTVELGHNRSIDDDALAWLAGLRKLRVAYLYHTSIAGPGIAHLKGLSVECLELSRSPLTDEGLKHARDMRRLRYLGLDNTLVTNQGLIHLAGLPKLTELRLRYTEVSDEGLVHLQKIGTLKSVSLSGTKVTAPGVAKLEEALPNCTILANYGLGLVADQELLFPEGYRATTAEIQTRLDKKGISYSMKADSAKPGKPITEFRVDQSTLGERPILQLVHLMPELEELSLDKSLVGDALLEGLIDCGRLRYLMIRDGRLSDDGLRHLQKIPSLTEIQFHEQVFTDAAVEHLGKLKQLKSLVVEGSKLTDKGMDALKSALPGCRLYQ